MAKQTLMLVFLATCFLDQVILSESTGDFSKLNDYLLEKVDSENGESNIAAAQELLSGSDHDQALAQAAEMLLSLSNLEGKCDKEGYQILKENVDATEGGARQFKSSKRRIDSIVQQYAIKYARGCDNQWASKLSDHLGKLDVKTLSRIEIFTDNMMGALAEFYRNVKRIPEINMYRMWKVDLWPIFQEYEDKFAARTLDTLVAQTAREFKSFIRVTRQPGAWPYKQEPGVLFNKLVLGPCKAYVNALESEVIEPTTYAAFFYHNIQMKSQESINFHKDWLRFRICKLVTQDDSSILLNAVKRAI